MAEDTNEIEFDVGQSDDEDIPEDILDKPRPAVLPEPFEVSSFKLNLDGTTLKWEPITLVYLGTFCFQFI